MCSIFFSFFLLINYSRMGLLEVCCSSEWFTMTEPVIRDENANMIALAVRTPLRADETPVRRETTTKTLSGTRKRDESYKSNRRRC